MPTTVGVSVVVTNSIRSPPGTNRHPDPLTIGGTGTIGGTAIHPSGSGVMLNTPDDGKFTYTGTTSMNGGMMIGRMNEPMLVAAIWLASTFVHVPVGLPVASVV